jgi:hypothetical protein
VLWEPGHGEGGKGIFKDRGLPSWPAWRGEGGKEEGKVEAGRREMGTGGGSAGSSIAHERSEFISAIT